MRTCENSMQKELGAKPKTFLLQGNSATNCDRAATQKSKLIKIVLTYLTYWHSPKHDYFILSSETALEVTVEPNLCLDCFDPVEFPEFEMKEFMKTAELDCNPERFRAGNVQ
ncbi:hypothetical protein XENORESO_019013 [Xenotaenia resolanae]|uniref:Uncharacterized protein n=1 Tax=Xenotaenia resolanae TaxID=208358 RepID=A0ABV0XB63_9TELE